MKNALVSMFAAGAMLVAGLQVVHAHDPCEKSSQGREKCVVVRDGRFRALLYTRTAGFRHPSIPAGIQTIQELGDLNNFGVDATEDPNAFTPENLDNYELVIFLNTTLDVLDGNQQQAFEAFVRGGGAFVGVHSAADTEHDWPFYGELVGAYFLAHPVLNQPGTVHVEDPYHPSVAHLDNPWEIRLEEFYSFKSNPRGRVRVLLSLDESTYRQEPNTSCDPSGPTFPQGYDGKMGDHPVSWCHDRFAGRAWYTALGHEVYLYGLPAFRQHLLKGIMTATRRVPARCDAESKVPEPAYVPVLEACENQLLP